MTGQHDKRHEWIDLARGVAMVLVVLGHALIGAATSLGSTHLSRFCILLIYCVHMPVLFALAGQLNHRLISQPPKTFSLQLLKRIVWPYILWSSLLLLLHFAMSDYTNSEVEVYRPISILWRPPAVMWFLYVMFCAIVLRRFLRHSRLLSCAVGFLCICLPYLADLQNGHIRFVGLYLLASATPKKALEEIPRRIIVAAAVPTVILMVCVAWQESSIDRAGYPGAAFAYMPMLFLSPLIVFIGAQAAIRYSVAPVLMQRVQVLGQHSMAIFVLHIFFTAGVRIILIRFGNSDLWVLTTCSTLVGLMAPIAIARQLSIWRIGPFLGWQST